MVQCDTWDNGVLACEAEDSRQHFSMLLSTKRIAPGHANTWFIKIEATEFSAEFSTKHPKRLRSLAYTPGGEQAWREVDAPYASAYQTISGAIFEFGFSDSILQMWAAFWDELVNGTHMRQPFSCATPEEAALSHQLFTSALESYASSTVERLGTASSTADLR